MAHSLSAKKRIRQSAKRNARNRTRKVAVKAETKAFAATLAAGDPVKAEAQLRKLASRLDRTAAQGAIHKKTAARRRSRMTKKLNAMTQAVAAKALS